MDKQNKVDLNKRPFARYLKLALIGALCIMTIIVCVQYVTNYMWLGGMWRLITIVTCCVFLIVMESAHAFLIRNFVARMVFFGVDSVLLIIICLFTGNTYLSVLYCMVLTLYYMSVSELKLSTIFFGISCGFYTVAYVCGWLFANSQASLYDSIVIILGDVIFGIIILVIHYIAVNFLIRFYLMNIRLREALAEADESKARLEEMSRQLLDAAVFEERNRIAKDIHDNAGHSMTAVIMQTEAAKLLIDSDPEEAKSRIVSANMQAKNALEQMRTSVHLLAGRKGRAPIGEEFEEIIAQTIDGTDLKVRYDFDEVEVDGETHLFLRNALKESLANGIRHGKATAFYIELKKSLSNISLLISDNGCGTQGGVEEGFGLRSMRQKAAALGGVCEFSSESGEGFEVRITLPQKKEDGR